MVGKIQPIAMLSLDRIRQVTDSCYCATNYIQQQPGQEFLDQELISHRY